MSSRRFVSGQQQQQQRVLILEIGSAIIRGGYAGEAAPSLRKNSPLRSWSASRQNEERLALWFSEVLTLNLLVAKASQQAIVLVESPTLPRVLREAVASALSLIGPPPTITILCGPVACAAATDEACILVLDVGARETRALAIVDGYALTQTFSVVDLGLELDDDAFFLKDNYILDGLSGGGLALAVLRCLLLCPLETRSRLAAKIAPCGGGALLDDFNHRLLADLNRLVQHNFFTKLSHLSFACYRFPFSPPDVSWIGSSLLVATALAERRFDGGLSPAQLDQFGLLSDFFAAPEERTVSLHYPKPLSLATTLVPGIRSRAFVYNEKGTTSNAAGTKPPFYGSKQSKHASSSSFASTMSAAFSSATGLSSMGAGQEEENLR